MTEELKIRPSFWTFNIGHVLTLVTFLVASIGAYYALLAYLRHHGQPKSM